MTKEKPQLTIPAGKQVQDVKGPDSPKAPIDNRVQVHQGNVPVLIVHFLSKISESLEKIAKIMEQDGRYK